MQSSGRPSVASMAGRIAVGYAMIATLAVALALGLGNGPLPWIHPRPWLRLDALVAPGASAAAGIVVALAIVLATRATVARFDWARRLHLELRPIAHGLVAWQIALIACFSSLGEELLFRGVLQPWVGLLPASVVFGVLHQVPGPSRWVWMTWATAVGLLFGAIFEATGSLLGPLLAHALINAVNLAFLRDFDPTAGPDRHPRESGGPAR